MHHREPHQYMEPGEYALEQFKFVGDQRMKTFNYYAIVVAAAITGSIAAFDRCPWQAVVVVGVAHCLMAAIFFLIDIRNASLLNNARAALMHYEEAAHLPEQMRVISNDERCNAASAGGKDPCAKSSIGWVRSLVLRRISPSYTTAFEFAFLLQLIWGMLLVVAAFTLKAR